MRDNKNLVHIPRALFLLVKIGWIQSAALNEKGLVEGIPAAEAEYEHIGSSIHLESTGGVRCYCCAHRVHLRFYQCHPPSESEHKLLSPSQMLQQELSGHRH